MRRGINTINQDCLDIIVEFAAASVTDCLVLRGISRAFGAATHTHIQAFVAFDQPLLSPFRLLAEEDAAMHPLRFCGVGTEAPASLALAVHFSAECAGALRKLAVIAFDVASAPRPLLGVDHTAWTQLGRHPFAATVLLGCVEDLLLGRLSPDAVAAGLSLAGARSLRSLTAGIAASGGEPVSFDEAFVSIPVKAAVTSLKISASATRRFVLSARGVEGFTGLRTIELAFESSAWSEFGATAADTTTVMAEPLLHLLRQSTPTLTSVNLADALRPERVRADVYEALGACTRLTALKLPRDVDFIACPSIVCGRLTEATSAQSPEPPQCVGRRVLLSASSAAVFSQLRSIALSYRDVAAGRPSAVAASLCLPLVVALHLDLAIPREVGEEGVVVVGPCAATHPTPFAWVPGGLAAVFPGLQKLSLCVSPASLPRAEAAPATPLNTSATGCFGDGPLVLRRCRLTSLRVEAPSVACLRLTDIIEGGLAPVSAGLEHLDVVKAAVVDVDALGASDPEGSPQPQPQPQLVLPWLTSFHVDGLNVASPGGVAARRLFGAMPRLEALSASAQDAHELDTLPTTLQCVRLRSLDEATATHLVRTCPRLRTVSLRLLRPSDRVAQVLAQGVKDEASGAHHASPVASVHASGVGGSRGQHFDSAAWAFRTLHPRRGSWVATRVSTNTWGPWTRRD